MLKIVCIYSIVCARMFVFHRQVRPETLLISSNESMTFISELACLLLAVNSRQKEKRTFLEIL